MKVVCEVHILSRFHFFFQLSQPNRSSFYPDLDFFQLSQVKSSSSYPDLHEKKAKKFSSFFSESEPNAMRFISCNYFMKKGHVLNKTQK